ncbi:MAG: hypothetical protein QXH81_08020 [Thermofilaceae archaeon]
MSLVWVSGGNMTTGGLFCSWDGTRCVTRVLLVYGGNLYTFSETVPQGGTCTSVTAVRYSAGNLTTTSLSGRCIVA